MVRLQLFFENIFASSCQLSLSHGASVLFLVYFFFGMWRWYCSHQHITYLDIDQRGFLTHGYLNFWSHCCLFAVGRAAKADLTEKGVLMRVSEITDWCSPCFFVPKSDGRVRLVTDFTHLNRYVERPVHPFPSTRDILQSIPHDAIYFLKLDTVHGYFQLALLEENFSPAVGKIQVSQCPNGTQCLIQWVVLSLWQNGSRTALGQGNCGQHNYLGTNATKAARKSEDNTRKESGCLIWST